MVFVSVARPKPEEFDSVAHTLALSVMIINDFGRHRMQDYASASTLQQSEGDSGVFLQYIHARLRRFAQLIDWLTGRLIDWLVGFFTILSTVKSFLFWSVNLFLWCSLELNSGVSLNPNADFTSVVEPEALELVSHLADASVTAERAFREYEPVHIVKYLFRNGYGNISFSTKCIYKKTFFPFVSDTWWTAPSKHFVWRISRRKSARLAHFFPNLFPFSLYLVLLWK